MKFQTFVFGWIFSTEYIRKGACRKTGQCCQAIGMELPRSWLKNDKVAALFIAWHDYRYNFEFIGVKWEKNLLVYECRFFTKERTCGIRRWRPKLCRQYPTVDLKGKPRLHKGCGYYFESRRNSKGFEKSMHEKEVELEDEFRV